MLVTGGRSRRTRALAIGGLSGGLAFLTLVSCGGRTSALDTDGYGTSTDGDEGGSSNGGRPSVAGSPSIGGAAAAGGTSTSMGGTSGVNESLSIAPCNAYCPGYGTQCAQRLMGQDCMTACQSEVNSFGPRCQALGISALKCLTPFFTPNGFNCDATVNAALTKCGKVVNDFQTCKGPQKPNMPMPSMPSTPSVASCPGMGVADSLSCVQLFACGAGVYTVICGFQPGNMIANCSCTRPNGSAESIDVANDGNACMGAASLCD